jgi:hypothetical protein
MRATCEREREHVHMQDQSGDVMVFEKRGRNPERAGTRKRCWATRRKGASNG